MKKRPPAPKRPVPTWTTAVPDWPTRIVNRRSLIPCAPLFPAEAAAAMRIFKSLKLVDVAGSPTIGEACEPWVLEFAAALFGSYDAETGRRLIRNYWLMVAKKNSKSTIAAAIMLTALLRNWRLSGEFMILAPTIEIAGNSFGPAKDMIAADPKLRKLLHVQSNFRLITHRTTKATLKVVAADSDVVGGKKAIGTLIDEMWLFGKRKDAESMFSEALGGLASRPEGFVVYLTTQSDEPPVGVFKTHLDRFRNVRDGVIVDPRSLAVIYEYPPDMIEAEVYKDPRTFYVPNPNYGKSVDEEFLLDEHVKAQEAGAKALRIFYAKHLNVEIGMNLRGNRWPGAEHWAARADPRIDPDYLIKHCDCITVGVDGGGLDDLFGLVLLGRERNSKDWLAWAHAWCHKGVLQRRKAIATVLEDFAKAGELTIVDDQLNDVSEIVEKVERVLNAGLLGCVAVDPAGVGEFVDALSAIDVTQDNKLLTGAPQGYGMMNAIKTAERRLARGTLRHNGSSLMAWAVGNLKIEPTATAIRATKQFAGDKKIDPIMALFDAVVPMMLDPEPSGGTTIPEDYDLPVVQ